MAVAGLIISAVGLGLQVYGHMQQTKAQQDAEGQRKKQMNLDTLRSRREVARNALMARSTALASGTAQGAQYGSGMQGGFGQVAGRAGTQTLAGNQNQEIGNNIFSANNRYYQASVMTDFGSGLYSLGGGMIQNSGTYGRIGASGGF